MKNIFITSFHSLISRNILQTEILASLKNNNFNIIIFCPDYKKHYFESEFGDSKVKVVPISFSQDSKISLILRKMGTSLLPTSSIRMNRKERFKKDGGFFAYFSFLVVSFVLSHVPLIQKIYRFFYLRTYKKNIFKYFFEEFEPVAVFSTDIFESRDESLMFEARKLGVPIIGMVRSWDNTTNKRILSIVPDKILTNNKNIKRELVEFHKINKRIIEVVGIPHFDYYKKHIPCSYEEFCKKTGLNSDLPFIVFAPTGKKFIDTDKLELQILIDLISKGEIRGKPQILVRMPPGDVMDKDNLKISKKVKVCFERPGVEFGRKTLKDREMNFDDTIHLANTLYHANVVVSAGSTLCIDSATINTPIICPNYDNDNNIDYFRTVKKMYKKYHYRYILESPACPLANTISDLKFLLNKYIENPSYLKKEREEFAENQIYKNDGKASWRVVNSMLKFINERK